MACMTTDEKTVSLKLMIDKKAKKVAFAEVGHEYVEFISQMVSMPLSTFIMGGSLYKPSNSNSEPNSSTAPPDEHAKTDGCVYLLTDNLEVKHMSTALIMPFVKGSSFLEEKVVHIGSREALAMLKASFQTNAVLTTVFLSGNVDVLKPRKTSAFRKVLYVMLVLFFIAFLVDENSRKIK